MRRPNGFTILEVMIVVVTLGILAVLVMPQLASATEDATRTSIRGQLEMIDKHVEVYKTAHDGALPTQDPNDPMGDDGTNSGWGVMISGGYLKEQPQNAYTGSTIVAEGSFADARDATRETPLGWHYKVVGVRLDVYAIGYDPDTDTLEHE
ncbi:MAG: prepilin-type N-terminal cleavage/methylation domain-containing protein [Planctomycetota bacterium]